MTALDLSAVGGARSRLTSIDVLRGLSVAVMVLVNVPGNHAVHPLQFTHVSWAGFRVAETVFPGFIVSSGGALALTTRTMTLRTTLVRFARILVVGLLLVSWKDGSLGLRSGTLQFIAGSWLVAALLYRLPSRWRVPAAMTVMTTVAVLHLVPALPGVVGWGRDGIDAHVDAVLFGKRSDLGVLGMISAGCVGLIAAMVVGRVRDADTRRRIAGFAMAAVASGALAAALVAVGVPLVKRTWTPSYLLLGAAVCFGVLALAEGVAASPARRVLEPLVALGRNALPLYVLCTATAIVWTDSSRRDVTAWIHRSGLGWGWSSLVVSLVVLGALTVVAWWLRRTGRVVRL